MHFLYLIRFLSLNLASLAAWRINSPIPLLHFPDRARPAIFPDRGMGPTHEARTRAPSMRIFLSTGEPSGDLHAANLIHSLRRLRPDVEVVGFGGPKMEAAGAKVLYPLVDLAVMWFVRVLL